MVTDWNSLIHELGDTSEGDSVAKKALEKILGKEWIEHTVEEAISTRKGSECALSCLKRISADYSVDYAYSIYKSDTSKERKNMAVWLIKHLAIKKSYQWVEEFLNDKNVVGWGIDVLDQLLWRNIIDYEEEKERVEYLMQLAIKNSDGRLQNNVDFINSYLNL